VLSREGGKAMACQRLSTGKKLPGKGTSKERKGGPQGRFQCKTADLPRKGGDPRRFHEAITRGKKKKKNRKQQATRNNMRVPRTSRLVILVQVKPAGKEWTQR